MKILIVDDETVALTSLKRLFRRRGYANVEICNGGRDAVEKIISNDFDVVFLDLLMPETDGMKVLQETKPYKPDTEFIILTALDNVETAVKAIRLGAYDYLVKTADNDRIILTLQRAFEHKGLMAGKAGGLVGQSPYSVPEIFGDLITQSPRMLELLNFATVMAKSGNPILITGESGTGKELLAKGIHRGGPCPDGPFVPVNVASITETLFESQFFGHLKGAFTGASDDHKGFFQQAHGGTLFLDEIGELPKHLQAKLLRVLEDSTLVPIGSTAPISVSVRIVSATNQDLHRACQENRFRLDLMYRLKSATIHLPPLRERREDISLLANHFLKLGCERHNKKIQGFNQEAKNILRRKNYPGNVRELRQLVETAVIISEAPKILPRALGEESSSPPEFSRSMCTLREDSDVHVVYVLSQLKGDKKKAAKTLGITVRQLQRRVAQLKTDARWQPLLGDL